MPLRLLRGVSLGASAEHSGPAMTLRERARVQLIFARWSLRRYRAAREFHFIAIDQGDEIDDCTRALLHFTARRGQACLERARRPAPPPDLDSAWSELQRREGSEG